MSPARDRTTVRRRRPLVRLAVTVTVVLVLLGALAVVDWRVRVFAEDKVADSVENQLKLTQRPAVDIAGGLLLPQLARRDLSHIDVTATDVVILAEGLVIRVNELDLDLIDVRTTRFTDYTAGELRGTARIRWSSAQEVVNIPVRYGENGRIMADYDQDIMGQSIHLAVSAVPSINQQTQEFQLLDARAAIAGYQIPDEVVQATVDQLVKPTPITLPLGLRATGVRALPEGLELEISGTDVRLTS